MTKEEPQICFICFYIREGLYLEWSSPRIGTNLYFYEMIKSGLCADPKQIVALVKGAEPVNCLRTSTLTFV